MILNKFYAISFLIISLFLNHCANATRVIKTSSISDDQESEFSRRLALLGGGTVMQIYSQDSTVNYKRSLLTKTDHIFLPIDVQDGPATWETINKDSCKIKAVDFLELKPDTPDFLVAHTCAIVLSTLTMCRGSLEAARDIYPDDTLLLGAITYWDSLPYGRLNILPLGLKNERNAYYSRQYIGRDHKDQLQYESELSFGYFDYENTTIYTANSSDVTAHEAGHAAIDRVNPKLYESLEVETGAINEAIADLYAFFFILHKANLADALAMSTKNNMHDKDNFASKIAEQFGRVVSKGPCLRDLDDDVSMNNVTNEQHDKSRVLSGAYFDVFASAYHEAYTKKIATCTNATYLLEATANYALILLTHSLATLTGDNPTIRDFAMNIIDLSDKYSIKAPESVAFLKDLKWSDYLMAEFVKRDVIVDPTVEPEIVYYTATRRVACSLFDSWALPQKTQPVEEAPKSMLTTAMTSIKEFLLLQSY